MKEFNLSKRHIYAELKSLRNGRKAPSKFQKEWIGVLKSVGTCEVYVWYPKHKEEILKTLDE